MDDPKNEFDDAWIRASLVTSLRQLGLRRLCKRERGNSALASVQMSYTVTIGVFLGVVFSASDWLNANAILTVCVAAALTIFLALIATKTNPIVALLLLIGLWAGAAVTQAIEADGDLVATIVVPFALSSGGTVVMNIKRLTHVARTAPLALPIILSILIIPLYTSELWAAMAATDYTNVIVAAALIFTPLTMVVARKLRWSALAFTADSVDEVGPDPLSRVPVELAKQADDEVREAAAAAVAARLPSDISSTALVAAAERIADALGRRIKMTLAVACLTLAGITTVIIWVFAWILVPVSSVEAWTSGIVHLETVRLLGLEASLPLGIYAQVSALLGILATAVLMASVAVDDAHAERFAAAVLKQRIINALPFVVAHAEMAASDAMTASGDTGVVV